MKRIRCFLIYGLLLASCLALAPCCGKSESSPSDKKTEETTTPKKESEQIEPGENKGGSQGNENESNPSTVDLNLPYNIVVNDISDAGTVTYSIKSTANSKKGIAFEVGDVIGVCLDHRDTGTPQELLENVEGKVTKVSGDVATIEFTPTKKNADTLIFSRTKSAFTFFHPIHYNAKGSVTASYHIPEEQIQTAEGLSSDCYVLYSDLLYPAQLTGDIKMHHVCSYMDLYVYDSSAKSDTLKVNRVMFSVTSGTHTDLLGNVSPTGVCGEAHVNGNADFMRNNFDRALKNTVVTRVTDGSVKVARSKASASTAVRTAVFPGTFTGVLSIMTSDSLVYTVPLNNEQVLKAGQLHELYVDISELSGFDDSVVSFEWNEYGTDGDKYKDVPVDGETVTVKAYSDASASSEVNWVKVSYDRSANRIVIHPRTQNNTLSERVAYVFVYENDAKVAVFKVCQQVSRWVWAGQSLNTYVFDNDEGCYMVIADDQNSASVNYGLKIDADNNVSATKIEKIFNSSKHIFTSRLNDTGDATVFKILPKSSENFRKTGKCNISTEIDGTTYYLITDDENLTLQLTTTAPKSTYWLISYCSLNNDYYIEVVHKINNVDYSIKYYEGSFYFTQKDNKDSSGDYTITGDVHPYVYR